MKLSNKTLGLLGMACAPFLCIETHFYTQTGMHNTSLTGVCDMLYMLGWVGSVVALLRLRATGDTKAGRTVLYAQLGCLALACVWNAWVIVAPASEGPVFRFLDAFWPISNVFMLVTGTVVIGAGRVRGWQRFVPLVVGFWLPFTMLLGKTLGQSELMLCGMNGYSIGAWFGLGLAVFTARAPQPAAEEAHAMGLRLL